MTKTSRQTNTSQTTSMDVVIADPNTTMVLADEQRRDESSPPNQPSTNSPDAAIRSLAYQKWESAGCPAGDGTDFWLDAEQEIKVA